MITADQPLLHYPSLHGESIADAAWHSWMPTEADDQLMRAKCDLLRWCDDYSFRPCSLVSRHPLAVAVGAIVGAAALARLPAARRIAGIAAVWTLQAALRHMAVDRVS